MAITYTGSVDLISGIRPKNGGSFPLVEASDVLYASGGVRLNTLLNGFTSETGSIKTYVDNAISAETSARSSADSTLSSRVTTLESAVGSGGSVATQISTAVNTEKTRAQGVESDLDDRVSDLETAVGTGGTVDSKISSAVSTEQTRATTAESALSSRVTAVETAANTTLPNLISQTNSNLTTESTTRAEADEDLDERVSALESQVNDLEGNMLVVSGTAAMTDTSKMYINTADNHWYYYNASTSAWVNGGQAAGVSIDSLLTTQGAAADAKAVGDAISELSSDFIEQVDSLDDTISLLNSQLHHTLQDVEFKWEQGTLDGTTGEELASSGRKRSAFIPITQLKGATLTINGELTSGNKRIDAMVYDSNKSMLQRLTSYTETSILPLVYYEGAYYIRFVSENDNVEKMSISGNTYEFISDTNTALDLLSNQVNLSIQGKKCFELEWAQGTLDSSTGLEADNASFKRTAFITLSEIADGEILVLDELEFRVTVWEYDINKIYIGRGNPFTANTRVADTRVSANAKYVRYTVKKNDKNKFQIVVPINSGEINMVDVGTWESGSIVDGVNSDSESIVRSATYLAKSAIYGITITVNINNGSFPSGQGRIVAWLYDIDKKYVGRQNIDSTTTITSFVSSLTEYIRFTVPAKYIESVTFKIETNTRFQNLEDNVGIISAKLAPSAINLNKDKEPLIYSASNSRQPQLGNSSTNELPGSVLGFIHFSDIHGTKISWQRICDYYDHFSNLFSFAIHTGDFVPDAQNNAYNLYNYLTPQNPIFNVVGNHDAWVDTTYTTISPISTTRNIIFSDSDNWGVTFPADGVMYYYKDFNNIRIIVLDQYYRDSDEEQWFANILEDARTNNKAVITASHTQTAPIITTIGSFNDIDSSPRNEYNGFESLIKQFKDNGGIHVAHLCGHWHYDSCGLTENGILNIIVECATIYGGGYRNDVRILAKDTRAYDCFNAVFVDTTTHTIRIIRIGSNTDNYLHGKNVMCINYLNNTLITNY